jgi:hypothetical protein
VLAPNNRTTVAWMDGRPGHEGQQCNTPGGLNATTYATCHVTKANFPAVAINLYNYNEVARTITGQTHPGYIVRDAGGVRVGIIGITSDVVPQQAQAFNTGFRFTMGYKELPVNIAAARAEGAELIVVLSELGLAKNIQLVKEFPDINVMFSGHTHERTPEPIIIKRGLFGANIGIVTEAGEDSFLGRLDVTVYRGRITGYNWQGPHRPGTQDLPGRSGPCLPYLRTEWLSVRQGSCPVRSAGDRGGTYKSDHRALQRAGRSGQQRHGGRLPGPGIDAGRNGLEGQSFDERQHPVANQWFPFRRRRSRIG